MNNNVYKEILDRYSEESRLRAIPPVRDVSGYIDLTGNDYLGLGSRSKEFLPEFLERSELLFTSSASRLLATRQKSYADLEEMLAGLYGKDVLLFNSGYHANTGCLSALAVPGTIFLADKLVHASAIDGLILGKSEFYRWRHNDVASLVKLLERHHADAERIIVVVESIYSMDGDEAPLRELVELKKKYPKVILYVDEAHGFGVRGKRGLGLCEELDILPDIDILIGTFGKACASQGAFAATSPIMRKYLLNSARSFIFSTALPPVCCDWTCLMIEKIVTMSNERLRLAAIARRINDFISKLTGTASPSTSQIIPLVTGDSSKAISISAKLRDAVILALPIRRPTVPPGTERIRFSFNSSITDEELDYFEKKLESVYRNETGVC